MSVYKLPTKCSGITHKNIIALLLLILTSAIVLGTYKDFGIAWDEPDLYEYATMSSAAYNPHEWAAPSFKLESTYGKNDWRFYGPAYLILGSIIQRTFMEFLGLDFFSAWHLTNGITFSFATIFLYLLLARYFSIWAALIAAFLFFTQPLLFGHAFFNPKDIPFLTFFLLSIFAGFKTLDTMRSDEKVLPLFDYNFASSHLKKVARILIFLLVFFLSLGPLLFFYKDLISEAVKLGILYAQSAGENTWIGKLFNILAPNAPSIGLEAYINKANVWIDRLPIVTTFLSILLGFLISMVLAITKTRSHDFIIAIQRVKFSFFWLTLAGILVGFASSIRVLGPLAGLFVIFTWLARLKHKALLPSFFYGLIGIFFSVLTWPYLWESPIVRFTEVFRHMSNNPVVVNVLYMGQLFPSTHLPASYFPGLILLNLTEPTLLAIILGIISAIVIFPKRSVNQRIELLILGLWFVIPLSYILIFSPPMYDGIRHFLFVIPPLFGFVAAFFDLMIEKGYSKFPVFLIATLFLLTNIFSMISLHPYQYAYFNTLAGEKSKISDNFETDYWLTCYKDALEWMNSKTNSRSVKVFPYPYVARQYSNLLMTIEDFSSEQKPSGYLLVSTRSRYDNYIWADKKNLYTVERGGVTYCIVRQSP